MKSHPRVGCRESKGEALGEGPGRLGSVAEGSADVKGRGADQQGIISC